MSPEQADKLKDFREDLHISHSQIFTYLNCSLKYYFSYVEGRMPEHRPAAMLFGSAIHAAIARYYKGVLKKGKPEPLSLYQDLFLRSLELGNGGYRDPHRLQGRTK